jgi:hypothetical protein
MEIKENNVLDRGCGGRVMTASGSRVNLYLWKWSRGPKESSKKLLDFID